MKLMQSIHRYDVFLFTWVMRRKSQKLLVQAARLVSATANGPLYLLLALALYGLGGQEERLLLKLMALALLIERPLYFVLKNACRRDRPPQALNIRSFIAPSDRFSFPSGHTSAAFLMATLLGWQWPVLLPTLLLWAVAVGMARVILCVHFPTDTLVGALMGTGCALLAMEKVLA